MTPLTEPQEKTWLLIRVIAVAMGCAAPAVYLLIASLLHPARPEFESQSGGSVNLVFYLLLLFALAGPLLSPPLERKQVGEWRRSPGSRRPDQMYFSLIVVRLAFVEACFIYGLVVYFLTWDLMRMLMFYPIGLVWLAVRWPRRERYERFLQGAEET